MAAELRKLGADVVEGPTSSRSRRRRAGGRRGSATYDDHRMAMCLSLAAFNPPPRRVPVRILDPSCVAKTFPDYFETLFGSPTPARRRAGASRSTARPRPARARWRRVAERLGYHLLDSGRCTGATALAALRAGVDADDEPASPRSPAARPALRARPTRGCCAARTSASRCARRRRADRVAGRRAAAVRAALDGCSWRSAACRAGRRRRDMGTVVFPAPRSRCSSTASAAQRAERRHKQLISKGFSASIDSLRADLEARDARDKTRAVAPLKPADDALLLDNSHLSIEESVQQVLDWWEQRSPIRAAGLQHAAAGPH
jgi:3-phosphoshikimate 1-carboxyvinyltransferase